MRPALKPAPALALLALCLPLGLPLPLLAAPATETAGHGQTGGHQEMGLPPLPYPAVLPPRDVVLTALRQSPMVEAAGQVRTADAAERERIEAGTHEWALRTTLQQRRVAPSASQAATERYREWQTGLEKAFRTPEKRRLDGKLGEEVHRRAQAAYGDALHEASRQLLRLWMDALQAGAVVRLWSRQADTLLQQSRITDRRKQLGDASRLEALQAEAALAQVEAALSQARVAETLAREALLAQYPDLVRFLDEAPRELPEPANLKGDNALWMNQLLKENHELRLARAETRHARLVASRAEAEQIPDPTVGVYVGSDRGGEERLQGITLTLPLPGEARRATARRDLALAAAAASREAAIQARVESEARALLAQARRSDELWRHSEAAAHGLEEAALLSARAYALGEGDLESLLLARRLAMEARLSATATQVDALNARYRLEVDSHRLWPVDAHDDHDEHDD